MWEYLLIFVLAATPWIEILFVIPPAIAAGLHPIAVAFTAFLGNILPIVGIIYLYEKWLQWRRSRQKEESSEQPTSVPSRRRTLGRKIWDKYGLPGLALLAPLVTGVHLAAIIALLSQSPRMAILVWMLLSLILWTVMLTVVTQYGLDLLGLKFD